jgi:hypothetical protein
MELISPNSAKHIAINPGNVLTIGILSTLWWGVMTWTSNVLARQDIPVISPLAVGAQNFLHAA